MVKAGKSTEESNEVQLPFKRGEMFPIPKKPCLNIGLWEGPGYEAKGTGN